MTDPRLKPQHPEDLREAMAILLSPDPALFDVPTLAAILEHFRAASDRSNRINAL